MSRVRREPREIITHGEDGLVVPDRRPVENDAERGRTAVLSPRNGRTSSKAAAGLRRLTGLFGLGVARRSRPLTVDCRVMPGGSLAFEVSAGQPVPRNRQLVLQPRNENIAATAQIQFEQPDTGGDGSVRAVLDKRHWELAEGDWDVFLRRAGGSRSRPVRAGLVETARLLDPAVLRAADEGGRTWIPYATEDGGLAVRTWLRPAHAEVVSVEVDDHAIRLKGSLHGRTARAYHYRFLARLQDNGGHLIDAPCFVDQHGDFRITLPVDVVAELHPGGEALWDLRLSAYGGPEIRLAMLAGDLVDRRDVSVFPALRCAGPGGGLSLRPQLTRDHDLVLRTADTLLGRP